MAHAHRRAQTVVKVIKQAGKKRLVEALERFAPKPKDVMQDGFKAFAELSSAQVCASLCVTQPARV
jgi:hypothetical protein